MEFFDQVYLIFSKAMLCYLVCGGGGDMDGRRQVRAPDRGAWEWEAIVALVEQFIARSAAESGGWFVES